MVIQHIHTYLRFYHFFCWSIFDFESIEYALIYLKERRITEEKNCRIGWVELQRNLESKVWKIENRVRPVNSNYFKLNVTFSPVGKRQKKNNKTKQNIEIYCYSEFYDLYD